MNTIQITLEELVRGWLAKFGRLVPWEPVESLQSFMEVLAPCIVNKMEPELANALRRNRIESLGKRAFRWLEKSFWEDISKYPDDPLDKRISRLKTLFDTTQRIPPRQGDGEYFPISVFVEYDSMLKLLEPIFLRRPAKVSHLTGKEAKLFASETRQGTRGMGQYRSNVLDALNAQRIEGWKKELLQQADREIPVEFWRKGQEIFFKEEEILQLTARSAALKILGTKLGLGKDAVQRLVKEGKKMLPPRVLKKMETSYAAVDNNNSLQVLNRLDPLK